MFTGIIEGAGKLIGKRKAAGGLAFEIEAGFELKEPVEGESIAVNGVCLTAYAIRGKRFCADVSPETLSRATLGKLTVGSRVNLERALRLNDRLGGHLVSGHVDCQAKLAEISPSGGYTVLDFHLPSEFSRYLIEKGSVAIDGISLTVNRCDSTSFSVSIIPHTMKITTLGLLKRGDAVNIEVDLVGKYIEKLLSPRQAEGQADEQVTLDAGFLARHGFF